MECQSAFARVGRDGGLSVVQEEDAKAVIHSLSAVWPKIQPVEDVRALCGHLLLTHPLRAADALQLAAAIVWPGGHPSGDGFVCLDLRLREAARMEGFHLLPTL